MDDFGQNLAQNEADWYMNGSHFSWKVGICMGPISNSSSMSLPKPNLSYPLLF